MALAASVLDELPPVRAVTMKWNHDIMWLHRVKPSRQQLDIALLGTVKLGREDDVSWF